MRAEPLQANFDAIVAALNGGLDAESLADSILEPRHFGTESVTTAALKDNGVTIKKLEKGLVAAKKQLGVDKSWGGYKASDLWNTIEELNFTVTPSADCTMIFNLQAAVKQALASGETGVKNCTLYACLADDAGNIKAAGQLRTEKGDTLNTIPVCGAVDLVANTTYNFRVKVRSYHDGALYVSCNEARTSVSAFILPR